MDRYIIIILYVLICILVWHTYFIEHATFKIDGDEIYELAVTNMINSENSRFNYKTKECSHWYSREIVNEILDMDDNKEVLILGVALGGQIIHLLNKDSEMNVTGVDISDDNFNLVEKYSDINRLTLIKEDAYNYILKSKTKYNAIVCDIFIGMNVADFAINEDFLKKINELLLPGGKLLLNTTTDTDKELVMSRLKNSFNNIDINILNNPRYVNNLYFVTKK